METKITTETKATVNVNIESNETQNMDKVATRLGIVAFGDYCDMKNRETTKLSQKYLRILYTFNLNSYL